MLNHLWSDDRGAVITAEIVIVTTVLVLSLIVGLSSFQSALINEVTDIGNAIDSLDQSYAYAGFRSVSPVKIKAWVRGSRFIDAQDVNSAAVGLDCSMVTGAVGGDSVPAPAPAPAPAPVPTPAPVNPCPPVTTPEAPCEIPSGTPAPYTLPAPTPIYTAPPTIVEPGVTSDHCAPTTTVPSGPMIPPTFPVY